MQEDKKMPNITIYLNTELYDFVKAKAFYNHPRSS